MTGDESGDLTGRRLGNYRIDSVLGKGGMSVMYRATDIRLGRKVALKVIGEHLGADAEFRERFVDEARNTSAIDHANIVPLYDFGELDGMLYIAMRLVDGSDLASRIGGEPMRPERAIGLLEQVADALDTLHERGLVHLDVKPANVLVTGKESTREHVYIADFGLTRRGATGHRTRGGDFLGSPTYAAPEHLRGEPLDGRTDQYALACVVYACLTGSPPYQGEVSAVIKGHLSGEPPPIAKVTGLPPAVDEVVRKGMAKTSADRYGTCVELVAAVRDALRQQPAGGTVAAAAGSAGGLAAGAASGHGEGNGMGQQPGPPQNPGQQPGQPGQPGPPGQQVPPGYPQQPPGPPQHGRPPGQPPYQGPPQAPPPGYGPPPGQPPGMGTPPQGQPPQYYGQQPPPQQAQPQQRPPGYPPQADPMRVRPPMPAGGGQSFERPGGSKMWIVWLALAVVVVAGVVVTVILLTGSDSGGDNPGGDTQPTGNNTAPQIPVGPSGSASGQPSASESGKPPPTSIPIEPGN